MASSSKDYSVSKSKKPRTVPAFTVQSQQKNTKTSGPKSPGVFERAKPERCVSSSFRKCYQRGDFPIQIEHNNFGNRIIWKTPIDQLDLERLLPVFFEGLIEYEHPYAFLAEHGVTDLLDNAGAKVLPTIPYLIAPIRATLNTKDPKKICTMLKILQKLILCADYVGEALVPYYRQLLPVLGMFKGKNMNIGDKVEYGQQKKINLGDLIEDTLQLLEKHGGPNAFINIQYVIPTYQSCVGNR